LLFACVCADACGVSVTGAEAANESPGNDGAGCSRLKLTPSISGGTSRCPDDRGLDVDATDVAAVAALVGGSTIGPA